MLPLIYYQSFDEIVETYCKYFIKEFGERKYQSIVAKVSGSAKLKNLITEAGTKRLLPSDDVIMSYINSIGTFIFSSGQVQALGGILTLAYWHKIFNEYNQIADENDVKEVAIKILKGSISTFV